jgi:hypothetical protein
MQSFSLSRLSQFSQAALHTWLRPLHNHPSMSMGIQLSARPLPRPRLRIPRITRQSDSQTRSTRPRFSSFHRGQAIPRHARQSQTCFSSVHMTARLPRPRLRANEEKQRIKSRLLRPPVSPNAVDERHPEVWSRHGALCRRDRQVHRYAHSPPSRSRRRLRKRRLNLRRILESSTTSYSPLSCSSSPRTRSRLTMIERWMRKNVRASRSCSSS